MPPVRNSKQDMQAPSGPQDSLKLPDDAALARQTAQGSSEAFRALVDRHGPYLYGVARAIAASNEDAEDAVQETFLAALTSRFRGESAVRTWLVKILVRRIGLIRRGRRLRAHEPLPADAPAPRQPADASEARLDLARMLDSLSPEHRQVIVLREIEQMSYEQMAETLGVPRGTVESRLHRARAALRQQYRGYRP